MTGACATWSVVTVFSIQFSMMVTVWSCRLMMQYGPVRRVKSFWYAFV